MLRRRLLIWPPVLDAANSAPPPALNNTHKVISMLFLLRCTPIFQHAGIHRKHVHILRAPQSCLSAKAVVNSLTDFRAGAAPVPGEGDSVVLWALSVQLDGCLCPCIHSSQAGLLQTHSDTSYPSLRAIMLLSPYHQGCPLTPFQNGVPPVWSDKAAVAERAVKHSAIMTMQIACAMDVPDGPRASAMQAGTQGCK